MFRDKQINNADYYIFVAPMISLFSPQLFFSYGFSQVTAIAIKSWLYA